MRERTTRKNDKKEHINLSMNRSTMRKGPYDPAVTARKGKNAEIFSETIAAINDSFYTAPSGKLVNLPPLRPMLEGAECWHREQPVVDAPEVVGGTEIVVENNDCIEAAKRLVARGYNPVMLNFASGGHPGGGVENGARAQEETLCRRSTLARSIYTFDEEYARNYHYTHRKGNNYPLENLNFSAIYSPYVTFFREGLDCTFMEEPFQCAVVTCAALNLNGRYSLKLTRDGNMPPQAKSITANKIRTIFRLALRHYHNALVLGAFGCGAFRNPPEEMASIFKSVLNEDEFRNKFLLVTFAIIEDHNSRNVNLRAFRKVFE